MAIFLPPLPKAQVVDDGQLFRLCTCRYFVRIACPCRYGETLTWYTVSMSDLKSHWPVPHRVTVFSGVEASAIISAAKMFFPAGVSVSIAQNPDAFVVVAHAAIGPNVVACCSRTCVGFPPGMVWVLTLISATAPLWTPPAKAALEIRIAARVIIRFIVSSAKVNVGLRTTAVPIRSADTRVQCPGWRSSCWIQQLPVDTHSSRTSYVSPDPSEARVTRAMRTLRKTVAPNGWYQHSRP